MPGELEFGHINNREYRNETGRQRGADEHRRNVSHCLE